MGRVSQGDTITMRLKCTCNAKDVLFLPDGTVTLCPSCVQLAVMPPAQLREAPPLIKTDEEIAQERVARRKERYDKRHKDASNVPDRAPIQRNIRHKTTKRFYGKRHHKLLPRRDHNG